MTLYKVYRGQLKYTEKMYAGAFRNITSKDEFLGFIRRTIGESHDPDLNRLISFVSNYKEEDFYEYIEEFFASEDFPLIGDAYKLYLMRNYLSSYKAFENVISNFLGGNGKDRIRFLSQDVVEAIMQHYGVARTAMLDVTWSKMVAIWFATHEFGIDSKSGESCYQVVEKSRWGFLYEIRVDSEKLLGNFPLTDFLVHIDKIDARMIRIERQCAAAIMVPWQASGRSIPLDLGKSFDIRIVDLKKKYKHKRYRHVNDICQITQQYLFPEPEEDPFYRAIKEKGLPTFPS